MLFLLWAVLTLVAFFLLVSVHELGHYLAGWLGGMPRSAMRIRLLAFPQHVALWNGDRWVPPMELETYVTLMQRHLPTTPRLYLYTAGGMLLETVFTTAVCAVLLLAGLPKLALVIAGFSLWLWVVYIVAMDVPMALRRGYPWGDLSGMWWLAKTPTLVLGLGMLAVRVILVWVTLR